MAILVTGGARSGKSSFAEKLSASLAISGTYIATSQIYDQEMKERVALHQRDREESGFPWTTIEEPFRLAETIAGDQSSPVILVDCLTLWLSNVLLRCESEPDATAQVNQQIQGLVDVVRSYKGHLILVTNEVGSGIVPEYPLGRLYRDLAGMMNRKLAEVCEQVFLVTAGIPMEIKSRAVQL